MTDHATNAGRGLLRRQAALLGVIGAVLVVAACAEGPRSAPPAPPASATPAASGAAIAEDLGVAGRLSRPPELRRAHRAEARAPAGRADAPCTTLTALKRGGDPVMHGTVPVYFIFSGALWSAFQRQLLQQFVADLSGSPPFLVNTTYADGHGAVDGTLRIAGVTNDNSAVSGKEALDDQDIATILDGAIGPAGFPADESAIYVVFPWHGYHGAEGAMCDDMCGYNGHRQARGKDVKFAVIPNPARCPDACYVQSVRDASGGALQVGPNGDAVADAMINTLFHEISELVTDPDGSSWGVAGTGGRCQNADLCHGQWGAQSTVPPGNAGTAGALYNFSRNGHNYRIQQLFVNQDGEGHGACVSSTDVIYTNTPDFVAGLGGAGEDRIVGENPCRPGYFRRSFDAHAAADSGGHCDTPQWMSDDLTDCRAKFHLGIPAVQHLHCVAHVTGATTPACPPGLSVCGSRCVDLAADATNCGACGNACVAGFGCVQGTCSCPQGQTNCAGQCVSLGSDDRNCGECGRACPSSQACSHGICKGHDGPCTPPKVLCCDTDDGPVCGPPASCSHNPACQHHPR
jgi:hypothetical protein